MAEQNKQYTTLLQKALDQLKAYREEEVQRQEPIAIVGMGSRLHSDSDDLQAFAHMLLNKGHNRAEVPAGRWDIDQYYDEQPGTPGKTYTRYAHYIKGIDLFDASFFGISPIEALAMDPQQRLLLETAWRAWEHAGYLPRTEPDTGVFIGVSNLEYAQLIQKTALDERSQPYAGTGNMLNTLAGRISYLLGLKGPALAIDTACSSSLVALHQAINSIRRGECRQALVGAANLLISPENTIAVSQANMLSPDGFCKTFDASADGYARGEGVAALLLKPLSAAQQDGDRICAIIRGSAVNHNGGGTGLTVPSGQAQQALIRTALADAGCKAADISYVEAHGTGTALGDPIEIKAIYEAYGREQSENTLHIGSVKANLGHLEAAAGMAGLIRVVLMMQHKTFMPQLHISELNPLADWEGMNISIPQEVSPWEPAQGKRLAGVSSFGFSGINAHVILEEAPVGESLPGERSHQIFSLSAKNPQALDDLRSSHQQALQTLPEEDWAAWCRSQNDINPHLRLRAATAVKDKAQLLQWLEQSPGTQSKTPQSQVWVFTGQGSQYPGMLQELYGHFAPYRRHFDACAAILREEAGWELPELAGYVPGALTEKQRETRYQQPLLFAVGYSLAASLQELGIEPDYMLGHSLGEYIAACLAGVFSLREGLQLVTSRGRLMQELPAGGGMLAVATGAENISDTLSAYADKVQVAGYNSEKQTVLAGDLDALEAVQNSLKEAGIRNQLLPVSHAFHSYRMAPMLDAYRAVLEKVSLRSPRYRVISNVTGKEAGEAMCSPDYWLQHIMSPVHFLDSIRHLHAQSPEAHWIEIGGQPTLLSFIGQSLPDAAGSTFPLARKGQPAWKGLSSLLAALYEEGSDIHWDLWQAGEPRLDTSLLPGYPFQRKAYWPAQKEVAGGNLKAQLQALATKAGISAAEQAILQKLLAAHGEEQSSPAQHFSKSQQAIELEAGNPLPLLSLQRAEGFLPQGIDCAGHYHASGDQVPAALLEDLSKEQIVLDTRFYSPESQGEEIAALDKAMSLIAAFSRELQDWSAPKPAAWLILLGPGTELVQAALWSALEVMQTEQSAFPLRLVSLTDTTSLPDLTVLHGKKIPARLLWQKGQWHSEQIIEAEHYPATAITFHESEHFLITGGTGELGLALGDYYIGRGLRKLSLLSRSGLKSDTQKAKVKQWEAEGVAVQVYPADVTEGSALGAALEAAQQEQGPITGIAHLAGQIEDQMGQQMTPAAWQKVINSKAASALLLDQLSRMLCPDLQHFVLFSSAAAWQGQPGQIAYAAANALLDQLAVNRRAEGLPALSVAWGPWRLGMASRLGDQYEALMEAMGIGLLEEKEALHSLGLLMQGAGGSHMVATIDLVLFSGQEQESSHPLLAQLEASTDPAQKTALLADYISSLLQEIAGIDEAISPEEPLLNLGLDSLMAVRLQRRVATDLQIDFDLTLILQGISLEALAAQLAGDEEEGQAETPASTEEPDLDNMSEEEIDAMLKAMMNDE